MQHRTKVVVIGLDGATWNIIKPLVEKGKLPTIEKLMQKGCYGDLESCIPPMTFPAWKCYSTGKNPGKLGAYAYYGVDLVREKFVFYNSTSFKSKELWDYLGENNIACGVLDMPTTYPCRQINGFMVSHGSPRSSGYAYPPDLERELTDRFAYKIDSASFFDFSKDAAISSMKSIINQRFDVAGYLLKKFAPPFFHLTIFNIDQIQHDFWREMEEGDAKYGTAIEDSWMLIDKGIKGLLKECCDEDTYVILMSDHGFAGRKGTFGISQWLVKKDLLKVKRSALPLLGSFSILPLIRTKLLRVAGRSRFLLSLLRSLIPKEIRQKFGVLPEVDWEKAKVIPVAHALYINRKALNSEQEYEKLRDSLIAEIKEIKNPGTGENLAKDVYRREEIYFGRHVDRAPDIAILPNEGQEIARLLAVEDWLLTSNRWTGVHKLQGIFLACGPGIKKGIEISGARIYDLAPTILYLFDSAIPRDMDGRVLKEIFEEGSALAKREIQYQEVDERARVKGRIKELKARGGL